MLLLSYILLHYARIPTLYCYFYFKQLRHPGTCTVQHSRKTLLFTCDKCSCLSASSCRAFRIRLGFRTEDMISVPMTEHGGLLGLDHFGTMQDSSKGLALLWSSLLGCIGFCQPSLPNSASSSTLFTGVQFTSRFEAFPCQILTLFFNFHEHYPQ